MQISNGSKQIVGYTTGVFDLFHIGHLNIIRNAKSMCDYLIVGVSTDEVVKYKHKAPVIPFDERVEVIRSLKFVDAVVPQEDMDKLKAWEKLKFDVLFVGDDWHGTPKWQEIERQLNQVGVKIVYFPYTKKTSSTLINQILEQRRTELLAEEKASKESGNI
jgi:glycerol-3-phosphate cytidylyltransferase